MAELRESVRGLEAEAGRRLQVLVNNAGRIESAEALLWEADPESVAGVVTANVLGIALMVNAFAPVLIALLFRIADSVVHFGHALGLLIFAMARVLSRQRRRSPCTFTISEEKEIRLAHSKSLMWHGHCLQRCLKHLPGGKSVRVLIFERSLVAEATEDLSASTRRLVLAENATPVGDGWWRRNDKRNLRMEKSGDSDYLVGSTALRRSSFTQNFSTRIDLLSGDREPR